MRYFLWCAITGELDTDWHVSMTIAEQHKARCGLGAEWRVAALSALQIAELFAVRS